MPEVSVILPTCDRPLLVGRALASLLAQRFADLEIVLVDANRCGPPVAANPALATMLADPRVQLVAARQSCNAAMSRNLGLLAARGTWITFLDDDDVYHPDKIASQHALAAATGAPLVVCGYEFVWPHRRRRRQVDRTRFDGDELITRAFLGSPVLFHHRDADVRFDERLSAGEDFAYALRFVARHDLRSLPCVPRALVTVHPQPAGQSVHKDTAAVWRAYRSTWPLVRRRFSPRGRRAWLARGRLERATGGYGSPAHFLRCLLALLRTHGLREWRLLLYSILARTRR